jgi:predicted DNA-binding ribbon-helix-helix protein
MTKTFIRFNTQEFPPPIPPIRLDGFFWNILRKISPSFVERREDILTLRRFLSHIDEELPFDKENSSNISKLTRSQVGQRTIVFKEPMENTNYSVMILQEEPQ